MFLPLILHEFNTGIVDKNYIVSLVGLTLQSPHSATLEICETLALLIMDNCFHI